MQRRKRLGLNAELYCSPMFYGLTDTVGFECVVDVVAKNAINMREHNLDAAFLSPIDYGRESSDYCIVPNIAASSRTPTNSIVLHFKEGLHTINTIAVRPTSTSEIVLASILMSEQFDIRPKIVPATGSFDQMLRSADAVLLVGNDAVAQVQEHQTRLDLVEEWTDMTDLPYVHGFWCVREGELSSNDVAVIQQACKRGVESIGGMVSAEIEQRNPQMSPQLLRQYFESFSFTFTEKEQDAVTEFLRYAYYHGILPDVADLHFYPMNTEDDLPLSGPSLN